jgi:transposase InsO family protein
VHGKTWETKLENLRQVLEKFKINNISLNFEKCKFFHTSVAYLGYVVEGGKGIKTDPRLIEKVVNFSAPKDKKQVQSFLSLTSFYRKFIHNYAQIAKPIQDLVVADSSKFKWSQEAEDSFKLLKNKLTTAPVLAFADFSKQFILSTDASNYQLGATLEQMGDDGVPHVIAYASRKLAPAETRYSAVERELLGVRFGVNHFKHYLLNSPPFRVISDNTALQWVRSMKTDNMRLAKWCLELEAYNFTIEHRSGILHGAADGLSRMINVVDIFDEKELQSKQENDILYTEYVNKPSFILHDGILYKKTQQGKRIVLPRSLVDTVLKQQHNHILSAHCGYKNMNRKIAAEYWWRTRQRDVKNYIQRCDDCNKRSMAGKLKIPLQELPEVGRPFERIAMDITQLPKTPDGYQYILTIICHFSRYLIMVPMKTQTTEEVARILVKQFILKMGVPLSILTDQGKNFCSKLIASVCELLQIKKLRTSPYMASANGRCEIVHKTVKKMLSFEVNEKQDNWTEILDYIVCAYNSRRHSSTQMSPYEVVYGRKMSSPFELASARKYVSNEHVQELSRKLQRIWATVKNNNHEAFLQQAKQHDKRAKHHDIKVGDMVYLRKVVIKQGLNKKLSVNWIGPYRV